MARVKALYPIQNSASVISLRFVDFNLLNALIRRLITIGAPPLDLCHSNECGGETGIRSNLSLAIIVLMRSVFRFCQHRHNGKLLHAYDRFIICD